jgi:type II secretory pathway component PulF
MFGIGTAELVHFSKNLSLMLKSGMTINESLEELSNTATPRLSKILLKMKKDVESGVTLTDALAKHRRVFGDVMISVVKAGEASGTLDENLNFLAEWLEHNADIKREVHGAMLYPAIVFVATIGVSSGLSLLVLPRLLPVFSQMKGELPLPTRILLWITNTIQESWFIIALLCAAIAVIVIFLNRLKPVRRVLHGVYLRIPFVGRMLREYQLTLIGQLFTTLFHGGLSIYEILDVTAEGATNLRYREAIMDVSKQVQRGTTLASALKGYPKLFPRDFTSILAVGEKSGTLDETFGYLTEYYRKEVYTMTKRLPTVIEPVLLLVMGVMVAFIAISIIMPIYQFTSSAGR